MDSPWEMDRHDWLRHLAQYQAIAILRSPTLTIGLAMARAVTQGGFRLVEVTWNSDRPANLVAQLRSALPSDCLIGVGTILTKPDLQAAIAAGAQFCFSPHTDPHLIGYGQSQGIPVIPGALTPTEIHQAWQAGADGVKVFPCESLGGPAYIRHLQGPMHHIPLIPTGGITVETGSAYLRAGATAIGISTNLFPLSLVEQQDWNAIQARSQAFLQSLNWEREPFPPSPRSQKELQYKS